MSLFVHQENQKMIWDAISQSILFQNLGDSKESWFRNMVEQFYNKISSIPINQDLLQRMNKDFIQEMLKSLKAMPVAPAQAVPVPVVPTPQIYVPPIQSPQPQQPSAYSQYGQSVPQSQYDQQPPYSQYAQPGQSSQYAQPSQSSQYAQPSQSSQYAQPSQSSQNISYTIEPTPSTTNYASRDYLLEQKQDEITKQFNSRTEQYQAMIAKNIPNANFPKEVKIEEPIANIDELVKRQLYERDQELLKYAPAPPVQQPVQQQQQQQQYNNYPILKITEQDAQISETVIEFREDDAPNNLGKSVHWTKNDTDQRSTKNDTDQRSTKNDTDQSWKESLELLKTELKTEIRNEIQNEIRNEFIKGFAELKTLLLPPPPMVFDMQSSS